MMFLIGRDISYTLSNKIHNLIGKINKLDINYTIMDINEIEFVNFFKNKEYLKYKGFNITIPYKEDVIKYLDIVVDVVDKVGAVNTVKIKDELLIGYNTDYYAFKKIIGKEKFNEKKVYLLGTGGAAKVCYQVFKEMNFEVIVVTRNIDRVLPFEKVITYEDFHHIKDVKTLINATPIGNINNPGLLVKADYQSLDLVIDLNYRPKETELMKLAKRSVNGLEMLILQAIYANEIWFERELKKDEQTVKLMIEEINNEYIW